MKARTRTTSAISLLLGCQLCAHADWEYAERIDAITDELKSSAVVTNELGYTFMIYRIAPGGQVWANFAIPDDILDQIDSEKPVMYRTDKHPAHSVTQDPEGRYVEWEPKWLNFLLSGANRFGVLSTELAEILEGEDLLIRYYLSTGGYKDTHFTLSGAPAAIANALDISPVVDHAKQQAYEEWSNLFTSSFEACSLNNQPAAAVACMERVAACPEESEFPDAKVLQTCLERSSDNRSRNR